MTTRDQAREVLRTLPDDYLRRYVEAFEERRLSCFPDTRCTACAVTVMAGANFYGGGHTRFEHDGFDSDIIERFYEAHPNGYPRWGVNAVPLYDECVLELARRTAPVPAEAVR